MVVWCWRVDAERRRSSGRLMGVSGSSVFGPGVGVAEETQERWRQPVLPMRTIGAKTQGTVRTPCVTVERELAVVSALYWRSSAEVRSVDQKTWTKYKDPSIKFVETCCLCEKCWRWFTIPGATMSVSCVQCNEGNELGVNYLYVFGVNMGPGVSGHD